MKRCVGWVISWALWAAGDIVSRCLFDATGWLYPVYNRLMIWSRAVQDWAGVNGPWKPPPEQAGEESYV